MYKHLSSFQTHIDTLSPPIISLSGTKGIELETVSSVWGLCGGIAEFKIGRKGCERFTSGPRARSVGGWFSVIGLVGDVSMV
jgi:hypothetical protein